MAQLRFRIRTIILDEGEEVSAVTANASEGALKFIDNVLPTMLSRCVVGDERDEFGAVMVTMTVGDMLGLLVVCNGMRPADENYKYAEEIVRSIDNVYYGLMEES